MSDPKKLVTVAEVLSRGLADERVLIRAGWIAYRMSVLPKDAPPVQLEECRLAFYAGAQHLFGSIMSFLEPGEEETPGDLRRMDNIAKELDAFLVEFKAKHAMDLPTKGRA